MSTHSVNGIPRGIGTVGRVDVTVREAGRKSSATIWRLLQLYLYEMSDHDGRQIGEDGTFAYPYFSPYWEEPGRTPLLIRAGERLAGFALVREVAPETWEIAEFFVLRTWRRQGVGRAAARRILDRRPGTWEIRFHRGNAAGAALWTGVAGERRGVRRSADGEQDVLRLVW